MLAWVCRSCRMNAIGKQTATHTEESKMNVMAQAHKATKAFFANANAEIKAQFSYALVLKANLVEFHKMNKAQMKAEQIAAFKADTIARFEKRIAELKIVLNGSDAQKYMVVCESLPIDFEHAKGWGNVESATKWNSRQFAEANASKVTNGNKQGGVAVRVDHWCEHEIQELCRLINEINAQ